MLFFPELNPTEWQEVERSEQTPDAENPYSYSFIVLARV